MRSVLRMTMAVFLWAAPQAALGQAQTSPTTAPNASTSVKEKHWNTVVVESDTARSGATDRVPSRRVSDGAVPRPMYTYWELEWVAGDTFCLRRRSTTNAAVAQGAADATWSVAFARANDGVKGECPMTPRPDRPPSPPAADDVARRFWDVRVLPDPVLKVVPDYAITGKLVYLQITGPTDQHFDVDNPVGEDVAITATSRYLVDWGDGTTTTTSSQGGPWPAGDVTHAYSKMAPAVTITVTQLWSAGWAAGANRGVLTDLRTSSSLALAVTQLQAVRNL